MHSAPAGAAMNPGADASAGKYLRLRRAAVLTERYATDPLRDDVQMLSGSLNEPAVPGAGQRTDTLTLRMTTSLSSRTLAARRDGTPSDWPGNPERPDSGAQAASGFRIDRRSGAPTLLAQNAAGAPMSDASGRSSAPAGAAPVAGAGETPAAAWGIPPIRWGGQLVTDLRADRSNNQPGRLQHVEIANIKASSYIWQPWFSRISGGVGLVTSKEYRKDSADLAGGQQRPRSKAMSGNLDVTLFPVSRFPFNAYFDVSDSRASGEASSSDTTNTRMGLTQSYRPLEGPANYTVSFNRSTLESALAGRDTVNALAASGHNVFGPHTYDLAGSYTTNVRSNSGENTALSNLSIRHSYRADTDLSVDSFASLNSSEFHLLSSGVPSDSRSRFIQGNTFATWRPDEDSPLFVTGGARLFRSTIASVAGPAEATTLSGNVAATYSLSQQTSLSASAVVTQLQTGTQTSMLTSQIASINHSGEPASFAGFDYGWNAGATAGNQTGLVEGDRQNLSGQAGHTVTRGLTLSENSQLTFSLGQNAGTVYNTGASAAQTLAHNGSVSWRVARDSSTSAYVALMGSDSRTFGLNANRFQMVNLQASGQMLFDRNASASMNLTMQGVKQGALATTGVPLSAAAPANVNTSGNMNFTHLRAFNVPRLRYTAAYTINDSQFTTRLEGDVNAPRERISQSFEQRFDYNIGRVAMRLSLRMATIEGRRDALIFFRLSREIGGY